MTEVLQHFADSAFPSLHLLPSSSVNCDQRHESLLSTLHIVTWMLNLLRKTSLVGLNVLSNAEGCVILDPIPHPFTSPLVLCSVAVGPSGSVLQLLGYMIASAFIMLYSTLYSWYWLFCTLAFSVQIGYHWQPAFIYTIICRCFHYLLNSTWETKTVYIFIKLQVTKTVKLSWKLNLE